MGEALINSRGYFWWCSEAIPDGHFAPQGAVTGALEVKDRGLATLTLDGVLPRETPGGPFASLLQPNQPNKSICGILFGSNRYVRLSNPQLGGMHASSSGPSHERFVALYCFSARETFAEADPSFVSLIVSLQGYEEWLRLGAIKVSEQGEQLNVTYSKPQNVDWHTSFGDFKLEYDLKHPIVGRHSSLSMTESARLVFSFKKEISAKDAAQLCRRVEDLMIILTDSDRRMSFPTAKNSAGVLVEFFYARSEQSSEPVKWPDCWTAFGNVSEDFGEIVDKWLSKYEQFGPGFHLYFGNRRNSQMYPEHRFASMIWGLESLHRRYSAESETATRYEATPLWRKILRIFVAVTKQKDQEWLAHQLQYVFEPTLADRLLDLCERLPMSFGPSELKKFAERCAQRRNELSHFGDLREHAPYDEFLDDVMKLNNALDLFYHAILLQEAGIQSDQICWWFSKSVHSGRIQVILKAVGLNLQTATAS